MLYTTATLVCAHRGIVIILKQITRPNLSGNDIVYAYWMCLGFNVQGSKKEIGPTTPYPDQFNHFKSIS